MGHRLLVVCVLVVSSTGAIGGFIFALIVLMLLLLLLTVESLSKPLAEGATGAVADCSLEVPVPILLYFCRSIVHWLVLGTMRDFTRLRWITLLISTVRRITIN